MWIHLAAPSFLHLQRFRVSKLCILLGSHPVSTLPVFSSMGSPLPLPPCQGSRKGPVFAALLPWRPSTPGEQTGGTHWQAGASLSCGGGSRTLGYFGAGTDAHSQLREGTW